VDTLGDIIATFYNAQPLRSTVTGGIPVYLGISISAFTDFAH